MTFFFSLSIFLGMKHCEYSNNLYITIHKKVKILSLYFHIDRQNRIADSKMSILLNLLISPTVFPASKCHLNADKRRDIARIIGIRLKLQSRPVNRTILRLRIETLIGERTKVLSDTVPVCAQSLVFLQVYSCTTLYRQGTECLKFVNIRKHKNK